MSTPNGVFVRLEPEQLQRLDDLAERLGITRTELARKAVLNGLDDLGRCVTLAEWPIIAMGVRLVSRLADDPQGAEEADRILRSIRDTKRSSRQSQLPGIEPA